MDEFSHFEDQFRDVDIEPAKEDLSKVAELLAHFKDELVLGGFATEDATRFVESFYLARIVAMG